MMSRYKISGEEPFMIIIQIPSLFFSISLYIIYALSHYAHMYIIFQSIEYVYAHCDLMANHTVGAKLHRSPLFFHISLPSPLFFHSHMFDCMVV